jgi:hypothetical protein
VGAGEAVRETPGRGLPASGGRALNANLVLKSKQDQPLVYIVFCILNMELTNTGRSSIQETSCKRLNRCQQDMPSIKLSLLHRSQWEACTYSTNIQNRHSQYQ